MTNTDMSRKLPPRMAGLARGIIVQALRDLALADPSALEYFSGSGFPADRKLAGLPVEMERTVDELIRMSPTGRKHACKRVIKWIKCH